MPWCLSCSTETSTQKRKCPECGQALTKGPGMSTPMEYLNRDWYAIRTVHNPEQAESLREFLESKDIDVAIQNGKSKAKGVLKMNGGAGTNMMVLVPADVASRAADLVRNNDWTKSSGVDSLVREIYPDEDELLEDIDPLDDESEYLDSAIAMDSYSEFDEMD